MRSIRTAGAALTLTGIATFAAAAPAFAGTTTSVTPGVATAGQSVTAYIYCGSEKATGATLDLNDLGMGDMPMQASTHKGSFVASFTVPATAAGQYMLKMGCSNGAQGEGSLFVQGSKVPNVVPNGGPKTGDGITSTAVGGPLTTAGFAVLGLSALTGALVIRKRQANASK